MYGNEDDKNMQQEKGKLKCQGNKSDKVHCYTKMEVIERWEYVKEATGILE